MSNLPGRLLEKQENQRQSTINLVLRAVAELEAEGYAIKIKDIIDRTGLSRSVFAKPHIREILVSNGIAKEPRAVNEKGSKKTSRTASLRDKLREKETRITVLTSENEALRDECALLRGRLFLLMQRIEMADLDKSVDFL